MSNKKINLSVRLQQAALALFHEQGYDRTTAAEIAARAGVTERTFFRYFPDKREVLFQGEATLRTALEAAICDAPATLDPLAVLFQAFRSVEALLEANRPYSEPRHQVISSTPALYERELAKTAALAKDLAAALRNRGVEELRAELAARAGMAAFVHAVVSWLEDPNIALGQRLEAAHSELKALVNEGSATAS